MIITINDLINQCHDDFDIDIGDLMCEYHLRWEDKGLSAPVNQIKVDKINKEITLSFNEEKVIK